MNQSSALAFFRALGAVLRAALLAAGHAYRIERAANHVIANAGQILHAAAADQHDGVLLQVVADARDVSGYFNAVGQAHARYLAQRRIRLLRSLGVNTGADATLLRTSLQRRAGRLVPGPLAPLRHQLIESRHSIPLLGLSTARPASFYTQ